MSVKTVKKVLKKRVAQSGIALVFINTLLHIGVKLGLGATGAAGELKSSLLTAASTPTRLIELVATAWETHGSLIGVVFDSDAARQVIAYGAAFEPLAQACHALGNRIEFDIAMKRAAVATSSLAAYAAMKAVVRTPEGQPLKETVDEMVTVMKEHRRGKRHSKPAAAPVQAPTPTSVHEASVFIMPKADAQKTG